MNSRVIKLSKIVFIAGSGFFIFLFLAWFLMPEILNVYEVRKNPELVKSDLRVIGKVVINDNKTDFFLMFDLVRDCKAMPVIYKDQMPEPDTEIIAYGKVRKVDKLLTPDIMWWEYYLDVQRINAREQMFSGNIFYLIRQRVHKSMSQLYRKCKICRKIKNGITNVTRSMSQP